MERRRRKREGRQRSGGHYVHRNTEEVEVGLMHAGAAAEAAAAAELILGKRVPERKRGREGGRPPEEEI